MRRLLILPLLLGILHAQDTVSTWAGSGAAGLVDGPRASAQMNGPFGMCRDASGTLYFADANNHCIRMVRGDNVTVLAGSGVAGHKDTLAAFAQFNSPAGVAVDDSGNVYVSDFQNMRIRKISADGWVTTLAGEGSQGYVDGAADSATFRYPRGIAVGPDGAVYVGDSWNHRIRKISGGYVSTLAGSGTAFGVGSVNGWADGAGDVAMFYTPCGLSMDNAGNLYVADAYNHRLRKVAPDGSVTTVAGQGPSGPSAGGFVDGSAAIAQLDTPTECHWQDGADNLFFSDSFNHAVRHRTPDGSVYTLAGTGFSGYVEGAGSIAQFNITRGIVSSLGGDSIWVCDYNNQRIRLVVRDLFVANEPPAPGQISVWPVPAHDYLRMLLPLSDCGAWSLTDMAGRGWASGESCGGLVEILLTHMPAGMYVLQWSSASSSGSFLRRAIPIVH